MSVDSVVRKIKSLLIKRKLSKIEEKRLVQDLEAVFTRFDRHEYKKFSYSSNVFDIPDRTRQIYAEVEFYTIVGKTWMQLLKQLDIQKYPKIADICPGYAPKVELALFYLGYTGNVIVIDKDVNATAQLIRFMNLFNPKFRIMKFKANVFKNPRKKFPLVTANHIIDDLILAHFSEKAGISLNTLYEKESEFTKLWHEILKKEESSIEEIVPIIVRSLERLVEENGILLITQYVSYMEKLLNLKDVSRFNKKVFKLIIKSLMRHGFVNDRKAVNNAFSNYKGHFGKYDCAMLKKYEIY